MIKTFPEFWTALQENPAWVEWMERINKAGLKKAAETAYGNLIADPLAFDKFPIEESRKYVGNILKKMPVDTRPFVPSVKETEEKVEVISTVSEEEHRQRLAKWKADVLASPILKPLAKLSTREIISDGQWDAPKEKPYNNGMDIKLYTLTETIKRFGRRKYKGVYSFTGFKTYKFGLVEVFADSEENALEILRKAERFLRLNIKL